MELRVPMTELLKNRRALAALAVFAAVVLIFALSRGATGSGPQLQDPASVLSVSTFTVQLDDEYEVTERFAGRVTSRRDSTLGFERGGLLAEVLVEEGESVEKGALLARLDIRALEAQARAIMARHEAAIATANEAEARLELAKVTEERQKTLVEAGHVSAQRFDEARFNRQAVQATVAAAHAQVASAEADLEQIRVNLALSEIRAPYSGDIIARMVDEGTVLSPGQSVVRILEGGPLEVRIGVPENVASLLDEEEVEIEVSDLILPARLQRLVSAVDPTTRTQTAIYYVDAPVTVQPGELAKLHLRHVLRDRGFWMPTEALAESQRGLWSAYALKPQGEMYVLERRPVELLHVETDRAFVRGTLEHGDVVVAGGLHRLVPGQMVNVRGE
ncbi:MAG: efflux RND transporter periplasmic adaptor subunit [Sphingomonadales bacterium]